LIASLPRATLFPVVTLIPDTQSGINKQPGSDWP
jgi:hypothetical protein